MVNSVYFFASPLKRWEFLSYFHEGNFISWIVLGKSCSFSLLLLAINSLLDILSISSTITSMARTFIMIMISILIIIIVIMMMIMIMIHLNIALFISRSQHRHHHNHYHCASIVWHQIHLTCEKGAIWRTLKTGMFKSITSLNHGFKVWSQLIWTFCKRYFYTLIKIFNKWFYTRNVTKIFLHLFSSNSRIY